MGKPSTLFVAINLLIIPYCEGRKSVDFPRQTIQKYAFYGSAAQKSGKSMENNGFFKESPKIKVAFSISGNYNSGSVRVSGLWLQVDASRRQNDPRKSENSDDHGAA